MSEYLLDLIDRMESKEWLPLSDGQSIQQSSQHQISFIAHREAETLTDPKSITELGEILRSKKVSSPVLRHGAWILGCLLCNIDSDEGKKILLSLFDRKRLNKLQISKLISAANKCRLIEARDVILELLSHKDGLVRNYASDYFVSIRDKEGVARVGDMISEGDRNVADVIGIGNINEPWVIPILENVISNRESGNKKADKECVAYAAAAIDRINSQSI